MNYILIIMIFVITIFIYKIYKNILFPSMIVCSVFLLSNLFLCLNKKWGYELKWTTCLFLITTIIMFCIGANFGNKLSIYKVKRCEVSDNVSIDYSISNRIMLIFNIISGLIFWIFVRHQLQLAIKLGALGGLSQMFVALRSQVQINPQVYALGLPLNIAVSFLRAVGYVSLFLLIEKTMSKEKNKIKYIFPVLCLVGEQFFSATRGGFISILISAIFDSYIIYKRNVSSKKKHINKKIRSYILVGVIFFFVVFWFVGMLTGSSYVMNFWDTVSVYVGSSLLCLDSMFSNGWEFSNSFGMYTFKGIYGILSNIGISVSVVSNHLPMFRWSNYSSNVYTSFFHF